MSNSFEFRCPVCRAKQNLQEACRRCKADLRLVVRAHQRVDYLLLQIEAARVAGDRRRQEALTTELRWLAPDRSG